MSLMLSQNGAKTLNITSASASFPTDIVPLTSIYALLQSHKLDFRIKVCI